MSKIFMRVLSLALVLVMALSLSGLAYADGEAVDVLAAVEEAVEETPVEEVPAEEEAPAVEETPAEEEAPVEEETPAEEEIPAEEETPIEEEAPALDELLPEDILAEVEEIVAEAEEEAETLLAEDAVFGIGSATYADLGAAIAAAKSGDTIVVLKDATVAGSYTIPAGVTLLVPFDSANTCYTATPGNDGGAGYVKPTVFRTLTLADGASITVNGAISVSAKHHAGAACTGGSSNAGSPTGSVGVIVMGSGSSITVNSGANLYVWGFISGSGSVTAKSGAAVYENFQVMDFAGGSITTDMAVTNKYGVFPLSQYFVQNIEVPVTFEYGSKEKVYTSVYMSSEVNSMEVGFIGEGGLFVPEAGTYLVKAYDAAADRIMVDVYGSSSIGAISLTVAINLGFWTYEVEVSSESFVLPINGAFSICLHSGTTTVNQSIVMHAGASVTIMDGATLDINNGTPNTDLKSYFTKGHNLVLFDADEWNAANFVNFSRKLSSTPYTYAAKGSRAVEDAKLIVDGTLNLDGYLYTTNGGASITGTGKIVMNNGAGTDTVIKMSCNTGGSAVYKDVAIKSPFEGDAGTVYAYNPATGTWGKQVAFSADIDKDGDTDADDLVALMKYIVGAKAAESIDLTVANVNGDDAIDVLDVIRWVRLFADGYVFA